MSDTQILVEVRKLTKYYPITKGFILTRFAGWVKAVDGVSFSIFPGKTLGLVGESGCGKTTTARMILLLEKATSGSILFRGNTDATKLKGKELSAYRTSVQAVFQDPYGSLNPRMKVGEIVAEPLQVHSALSKTEILEKVKALLADVGLREGALKRYPHEFSGGQRQRIAVARSLALNPKLVVLDEPVSALDVSIRAQVMNLLKDLQQRLGLAYLLIAHNLAVVRYMSDHVAVMYLGKVVEYANAEELYTNPCHPYTQALLSAALPSHPDSVKKGIILSGEVPSPINLPPGCHFNPRCFRTKNVCAQEEPPLREIATSHWVACDNC